MSPNSNMSKEIKKLQIRLHGLKMKEAHFQRSMASCLQQFEALDHYWTTASAQEDLRCLIKLHRDACDAYRKALDAHSRYEHEKSHLLESYGALISSMEKQFTKTVTHVTIVEN